MRRSSIIGLWSLALVSVCDEFSVPAAAAARPNILYIMADDMGRSDLGCYGQKIVPTPHIDSLAAAGKLFTQAYSGCSVCAPSRAVLMTGLHMGHAPLRSNPGGVPIRSTDVTIAQHLKKLGYATGGFGKWGIGDVGTEGVPEKHGFDLFFGYYNQVHAHYYFPEYLYRNSRRFPLAGNAGFNGPDGLKHPPAGAVPRNDPATGARRTWSHQAILAQTLQFISDHKDEPFFCYCPWTLNHGQWHMPDDDPAWSAYKNKPWKESEKVSAAMIAITDRSVGQVLALLRQLGLEEKTLVIFTSDNGAGQRLEGILDSAGPLRDKKGSMYEGGIRVPFVARWPGKIKPGTRSDLPIHFADMAPTFYDAATGGQELPPPVVDGHSITPTLFDKPGQKIHDYLYWENARPQDNAAPQNAKPNKKKAAGGSPVQAVRMGNWKGVKFAGKSVELYDLSIDESESKNVAEHNPRVAAEMETIMKKATVPPPPQIEPDKEPGRKWR